MKQYDPIIFFDQGGAREERHDGDWVSLDDAGKLRDALIEITKVNEVSPVLTYQKMEQIAAQALRS